MPSLTRSMGSRFRGNDTEMKSARDFANTDMHPSTDPRAFILANTRLKPVPHVPEIVLHVADESVPLWHKTEEELGAGRPAAALLGVRVGGRAGARALRARPSRRWSEAGACSTSRPAPASSPSRRRAPAPHR